MVSILPLFSGTLRYNRPIFDIRVPIRNSRKDERFRAMPCFGDPAIRFPQLRRAAIPPKIAALIEMGRDMEQTLEFPFEITVRASGSKPRLESPT